MTTSSPVRRRTKIVCTLGPATQSAESIEALIRAGMDVARLNFSHGTQSEHAAAIDLVRATATRLGRAVAILQDLQGPKIRTGALTGGTSIELRAGQPFCLTTQPLLGTSNRVATTYSALPQDVKPGDTILLADGAIQLQVRSTSASEVDCAVIVGGQLAEHQGINLPGVAVSAPALTEKDRSDLAFGVKRGVDFVALSFVRRPEDVEEAKNLIKELADSQLPVPVIAKLEKPEAISHLDAILKVADGVMVARGDLGVEMPLEDVPLVQKRIIQQANAAGLPVITATQMLESMIHSPRPTRAEASDVANAILDGTDALMLSGETAVGEYPVEAVKVMSRIAEATEVDYQSRDVHPPRTLPHAVSAAAHTLADQAQADLVVVFTRSGLSAQLISKERPRALIVAYTPLEEVYRRLALWWGVTSRQSELSGSTEKLVNWVDHELRTEGLVASGARVVIMGGMPVASRAHTNFVKLHQIGEA